MNQVVKVHLGHLELLASKAQVVLEEGKVGEVLLDLPECQVM